MDNCSKCSGPAEGYKCDMCGAESATHDENHEHGGEHHMPCVSVNGRSSGYYEGRTEREFKKICAEIDEERERYGSMPLGEIPPDDFLAEVARCRTYLEEMTREPEPAKSEEGA